MYTTENMHDTMYTLWIQLSTHWKTIEVFSPQWIAIIITLIIVYSMWWKFVDKSRFVEILLVGSLASVIFSFIDVVGETAMLWMYKVRLFPISPSLFPLDFSLCPIFIMFAYQLSNSFKEYLINSLIASTFIAFVTLPLYERFGLLELYRWNFLLSFIIIFINMLIIYWVTIKAKQIQKENKGDVREIILVRKSKK